MKAKIHLTLEDIKDFDTLTLAERQRILNQLRDQYNEQKQLADQIPPPDIYFVQN